MKRGAEGNMEHHPPLSVQVKCTAERQTPIRKQRGAARCADCCRSSVVIKCATCKHWFHSRGSAGTTDVKLKALQRMSTDC